MRIRTPKDKAAEASLRARVGPAALERHRARPRSQAGFELLAEGPAGPQGHGLLAYQRRRLGAATLEVAALDLAADSAEAVEPLLHAAVVAAAGAGLPFLVLRATPAPLAALGLAPCALRTSVTLPAPRPQRPLRPATAEDAEDLAALADAALADLPLAPRRAAPDWRWELGAPEGWPVLDDLRGRPVAYARLEGAEVVEAAAADAGAARELVSGLSARGAATLRLPLGHGVARAAMLLGGAATVGAPRADEPAELWGVVDLVAALESVAPELERRLADSHYTGWSGRLRLEGEAGAATLNWAAGRVVVAEAPGPVEVMVGRLGLAAAVQLLLGYRQAADLRATGELRCADIDLGLLDALFPAL